MVQTTLRLAPNFRLSVDFVTKTAAILAQRRKGKTYTASLLAEEFVGASIPFVALDPTGAWWGLRASADGKSEGLPVVILGGQYGDVPIGREDGAFVATLVVEHPGYYVIDFSMFTSGAAEKEFATDFAKTLYRLKMQGKNFPLHIFVDEAQRFVPQSLRDKKEGDAAMLGAFETLVLRGGLHGIGTTFISQRAAAVNKNVLEQIDMLICLRVMGPNDINSIDGYISKYAAADQRTEFLSSLPSLRLGEAWVYEPGGDPPIFEKVQFRERRTFNSSATPKPGEVTVQPTKLAAVDIEAVRGALAASIEETNANDPEKLKATIAEQKADLIKLRRELETERARDPGPATPTVVEVEVVPPELVDLVNSIESHTFRIEQRLDDVIELSRMAHTLSDKAKGIKGGKRTATGTSAGTVQAPKSHPGRSKPVQPRTPAATPVATQMESAGEVKLGLMERKIIAVLLARGGERTKRQLAVQCAAAIGGGGFNNALGRLRTLGIISTGAPIRLLQMPDNFVPPEGFDVNMPTGGRALLDFWLNQSGPGKLGKAEKLILETLFDNPEGLPKDELAGYCGYEPGGGGFNNALGKLRTLELVEGGGRGGGPLVLVPDFFE